jgi:thiol-disulfide isomerase/thioredoxin
MKYLFSALLMLAMYGAAAQNRPTVYGKVEGLPNTKAYLKVRGTYIDSCNIANSTFKLALNKMPLPYTCSIWYIKADGKHDQLGQIFVAEDKAIQIAGNINDFMSLRAKNSLESQILFDLLKDLWYPDQHRRQLVDSLHRGLLSDTLKVRQAYDSCSSIIRSYGKKYPKCFAVIATIDMFPELLRTEDYKAMLEEELKDNPYAQKYRQQLAIGKGQELKMALKGSSGKEVSLQSLLKKPTLLVVWATWCGPCRKELSYLSSLDPKKIPYDIVTLSVDENEGKWRDYLSQLRWNKLNYLWSLKSSSEVGIGAIPKCILVDERGVVIDPDFDAYSLGRK